MADDVTLKMLLVGEDKSASKAIKEVGEEAEKTEGKFSRFKEVAGGILTADVVKQATTAVIDFGKASIEAYRGAEADQRKLEDAYGRFPAIASTSIDSLRELNEAIEKKNGTDADGLAGAQATLAQYELTGEQIKEITPLLADYAAKTGKDLPAAAEDLGKAMLGSGKALKTLGIDFKDAGDVGGNFDQVVKGLSSQVGGFADKEAESLDGKMKMLDTQFGNLQETVGEKLIPVLITFAELGLDALDWLGENEDLLKAVGVVVGVLATAYGVLALAQAASNLQSSIAAAGGIINFIKSWAAQQAILNVVMSANPIGLIVIAIAALVAGLVLAYQKSETFRSIVNGAFAAIGQAATWLWNNAVQPVIKLLVDGFATVMRWVAGLLDTLGKIPGFGWAKDAAASMRGAADAASNMADGIKKIPDRKEVTVQLRQNFLPPTGSVPSSGGVPWTGQISGFMAGGGRPNPGGLYVVGEQGPEFFVPDVPGTILPADVTAALQSRTNLGGTPVAASGGPSTFHLYDSSGVLMGTMRGAADQANSAQARRVMLGSR